MTDHCSAIRRVLEAGRVGEVSNVGGWNEKANLEVVRMLRAVLDRESPRAEGKSYAEQITFVKDRPGSAAEHSICWNDPDLGLPWPTGISPILAAKDAAAPTFANAEVFE